jgi:hypothetical protein
MHPCRSDSERSRPGRIVLGVVVGQVEGGIGAVEDDNVEVGVLLDQADELSKLGDRRRGDRVDRRVLECDPAVPAAAAVDCEMRPGLRPPIRTAAVAPERVVDVAHDSSSGLTASRATDALVAALLASVADAELIDYSTDDRGVLLDKRLCDPW